MLTPSETRAIHSSWMSVASKSTEAGEAFYRELFRIAPDVRPLFRGDMQVQSRKLMDTLATVVNSLDDPTSLVPVVESLGRRHHGYGARNRHYEAVGRALINTLREYNGSGFGSEAEAAWTKAYGALSAIMQKASG